MSTNNKDFYFVHNSSFFFIIIMKYLEMSKETLNCHNKIKEVPWEPYKGATSLNKKLPIKENPGLIESNLVRYKVSTDLKLFNAQRPGSQFDKCDIELLEKTVAESSQSFVDARFYPDYYFLKLADELKSKCFDASKKSPTSNPKPINVVGPLIEKKMVKSNGLPPPSSISKPQLNKYEKRIEYLENQMKGIHEHLQIQTQVNSELKKLLVASIGEDIQYKLERLVNDKQRYSHELSNNAKELEKLTEEVEQCTIKCDLWRSKFLACRLMSDEAATWKSFLLLLNKQNEKVLRSLLEDNELLNEKLNTALDLLNEIKQNKAGTKRNFNNLQAANFLLVGLQSLIGPGQAITQSKLKPLTTENEKIGWQMLEQYDWVNLAMNDLHTLDDSTRKNGEDSLNLIDSFEKLEQLIDRIKISRSTIHSRLFQSTQMSGEFDLLVNVCNKCKGNIITV